MTVAMARRPGWGSDVHVVAVATQSAYMVMPLAFLVLQGIHPTVVRDGATGAHVARSPRQPSQWNQVSVLQVLHDKVTTSIFTTHRSPARCAWRHGRRCPRRRLTWCAQQRAFPVDFLYFMAVGTMVGNAGRVRNAIVGMHVC